MIADGKVTAYMEADDEGPALWKNHHQDGDEEELDERELAFAVQAYKLKLKTPTSIEMICADASSWMMAKPHERAGSRAR